MGISRPIINHIYNIILNRGVHCAVCTTGIVVVGFGLNTISTCVINGIVFDFCNMFYSAISSYVNSHARRRYNGTGYTGVVVVYPTSKLPTSTLPANIDWKIAIETCLYRIVYNIIVYSRGACIASTLYVQAIATRGNGFSSYSISI